MKKQFVDPYTLVTDAIIAQLEKGVVPWRCPWRRNVGRPRNFSTGQEYRGVNVLMLGLRQFASPYWMTWRQVQERGGNVKKGEHGSLVIKFGKFKMKEQDEKGSETQKRLAYLKGYKVFNATQIEGIEFPAIDTSPNTEAINRIARAKEIVKGMPSPPTIRVGRYAEACYRPATETIDMPEMKRFESGEAYYLTLFHELVHATGHQSRLNRRSLVESDGFGGQTYSQEELVAEMGAAFLGAEVDIVVDDHKQSAAYIQNWLAVLKDKDHKRWIVQAANQASRAVDFIRNRLPAQEQVVESATV